ncbi:MAG: hypothetical protein E7439_07155 [Ruminococcaceae bacterium]|nr:hypothetical protein [Oscillospiraceae bacterium]
MDDKRNTGEFSLEDILKEFGDTEAQPEVAAEVGDQTPEEDVTIWGQEAKAQPTAQEKQDTVRLDQITKAVRKQESALEQTVAFTPVGEAAQIQESQTVVEEEPAPAEPYSNEWEPEYEQPMGEYIPPEPIVHRPRSRLQELKKKLVAGPEKRYYELTELGLGKLQLAIFVNLVIALFSAAATWLYSMGWVPEDRMRLLIFGQFLTLLLSGLFGSYLLMEGFGDILRLRFSLNSLLIFSLCACLIDGMLCLKSLRVPCCAVFSLHMTMALWSNYQKRNTEMGQMDTMRKAVRLDSVVCVPEYYEGQAGFLRSEGQVEDFMENYNAPSGVEKTMSVYALVALIVSFGIGITAGVMHSPELGVQAFAAALLVAVPASAYVTISRPTAVLERRLHRLGTVLCGWQGVKALSQKGVFPLNDTDLFPAGSAKMNGVKFYGARDPDMVVAYGAALISACGGSMEPLFTALLESRNGYHFTARELRSYPSGGVGGEVNGESVLAGTLRFMQDMGVEIPAGTKVNQAVYVAIDGQLCGVFAITYHKVKATIAALATLCAYRKLTPVLTTSDFMLTEGFIHSRFGVNPKKIAFPERTVRSELAAYYIEEETPALALTTQEGLAASAFAVTGARALRKACCLGVTVHMLGGIIGLVMMLLLAILNASYLLTPANVLLYQLIWMVPGLLITEWTRSV